MEARESTFFDLVQGEKQFQVPLYQRPYSWTEDQLKPLWQDLLDLAAAAAAGEELRRHFLGSVVMAPSPSSSPTGVSRWLVVDGQQRLTTLMLSLAGIRDHLAECGEEGEADRIHRQWLVNEYHGGDDQLRLLPTQADRDSYRAIILRTPGAIPSGAVTATYRFARAALLQVGEEGRPSMSDVAAAIRSGLSLVAITAAGGDNVYRIFESLNNTGLQLSQADLLRNYLFMRMPTKGEDVYRDIWLPMQERLAARDLELLFWLDLILRGDERVKQTDIYRGQYDRLEKIREEDGIVAEVAELARRSRHLERIIDPDREPDPAIRSGLRHLQRWGGTTGYVLVLHLMDLLERGAASAAAVAEALVMVESYMVRRMICQVPSNNLNRVLYAAPAAVGDAPDLAGALRQYLSGRRRSWPSDAELRQSIATRPFYWNGRGNQRMHVLRRLEESYGAAEPVDFERAKLTIEHVLPQTPTPEWLELLAADVTDEAGPAELHELLVHTLGNLTLTAENSRLSNSPFDRKQDIYNASALQMNREIADTRSWGKRQIEERAARLANRAIALWPGPFDSTDDPTGRDWSLLRSACSLLPSGAWTTYGELAGLIGSHPVPVGRYLATTPVPNAWRVLTADGSLASEFRWTDDRDDDPHDLLAAEGVVFLDGRAAPAQRLAAADLAQLLGMDAAETPPAGTGPVDGLSSDSGRRFLDQLTGSHPEAVDGVLAVLAWWENLGGALTFGSSSETSCFLMVAAGQRTEAETWPLAIYPVAGSVEVVFQHMRRRPVFDDVALRREFRDLLQRAGVTIPDVKLDLRPSFPLDLLVGPESRLAFEAALEWFVLTFSRRAEQAEQQTSAKESFDLT